MYYGQGYAGAGAATRRYAAVHAGSRIEGASPHGLIKILFDELVLALQTAIHAEKQGERAKATDKLTRSLTILYALETSLDFEKGGDVAIGLCQIYREARKLLLDATKTREVASVMKAHAMIAEIAEAWSQIA